MRRTRILRIVTRLNTGGPATHLVTLSRALDPTRYEQWLIAGQEAAREGSMWSIVEARGVHPILVPEMIGAPTLQPKDLMAMARIRRLIREIQPDIVETHTSKAGIPGRLAACLEGTPIVLHVYHGHVLSGYYGALKTRIARAAERVLARTSDHLVAVSARVKEDLIRYGVAAAEQITVIEPGLDLDPLLDCRNGRGAVRRELGLDPSVPLVGIVGRVCPIKNPGLFLEAAVAILAARPGVRFLVVGDGESGLETRARARELNLSQQVIFTGWRNDLPQVYADLDALVSCSNNEGAPLALIEAMAAGCPIVAAAVGGVTDLIDDEETGLLVPPRNPQRLAHAILRLLNDPAFARRLAEEGRSRARVRFAASRLQADMDALYARLLHRCPVVDAISDARRADRAIGSIAMDAGTTERR